MVDVYVLGGAQTDFARNWAREGKGIYDMFAETLTAGVEAAGIDPAQIQAGHVGNFVGDLFARQGLINGFFGHRFIHCIIWRLVNMGRAVMADHAVHETFLVIVTAFRFMLSILLVPLLPILNHRSVCVFFPDHGDHLQSRVGGFEGDLLVRQHMPVDA